MLGVNTPPKVPKRPPVDASESTGACMRLLPVTASKRSHAVEGLSRRRRLWAGTPLPYLVPIRKLPDAQHSGVVYQGDNLEILERIEAETIDLVYIDPPFNTGKVQGRRQLRTVRDEAGDRVGFQGRRYKTQELSSRAYVDRFDDYLAFLQPRIVEAHRVLKPSGSFYFHIDYREVNYCKVLIDTIFGREHFLVVGVNIDRVTIFAQDALAVALAVGPNVADGPETNIGDFQAGLDQHPPLRAKPDYGDIELAARTARGGQV